MARTPRACITFLMSRNQYRCPEDFLDRTYGGSHDKMNLRMYYPCSLCETSLVAIKKQ